MGIAGWLPLILRKAWKKWLKNDEFTISFCTVSATIILIEIFIGFHILITPKILHYLFETKYDSLYLTTTQHYQRELIEVRNQLSTFTSPVNISPVSIPVYYINLNEEFSRRDYIRDQLRSWGFQQITRVSAWTDHDAAKYVTRLITSIDNLRRPNDKEIACIASHLYAMYLAVTDTSNTSPYALIVEDDLNMEVNVDWEAMIAQAPKDFSILQVMTSNSEGTYNLWREYLALLERDSDVRNGASASQAQPFEEHTTAGEPMLVEEKLEPLIANPSHQWKLRKWTDNFWSTQAYIIRKEQIKPYLLQIVSFQLRDHHYRILLRAFDRDEFGCTETPYLCLLPFRVVADTLLYTYFKPTYITRIPFLNGASAVNNAKVSLHAQVTLRGSQSRMIEETTSISDEKRVAKHQMEFQKIHKQIQEIVKDYMNVIPNYFSSFDP